MNRLDHDVASHYIALADRLETDLDDLEPGARLPSEHQLCAANRVSRVTARSALQELERRHLVRRTRGSGTYAALRIPYPIRPGTAPSWSAIVLGAGHTPSYEITDVAAVPASDATARALTLSPGTPVLRIERVGLIDGQPAAHHVMHFVTDAFGSDPTTARMLLDRHRSTTVLLANESGIEIERASTRCELRPVDSGCAESLDLVGRPMAWRTETVNRSADDGQRIEHTTAWLRADSFRVYMELISEDEPSPFETPSSERTP